MYMCMYSVAQSYLTFCGPIGCSLPDSSAHGIFQARILEWVPIPYFRDILDPQTGTIILILPRKKFNRN